MKALIRNYRGKSYLDPMMTLRQAFSDIEPAYLSKRIAREGCDEDRREELVNCLEDNFFEVDRMINEVRSTLAYNGCEEV